MINLLDLKIIIDVGVGRIIEERLTLQGFNVMVMRKSGKIICDPKYFS